MVYKKPRVEVIAFDSIFMTSSTQSAGQALADFFSGNGNWNSATGVVTGCSFGPSGSHHGATETVTTADGTYTFTFHMDNNGHGGTWSCQDYPLP